MIKKLVSTALLAAIMCSAAAIPAAPVSTADAAGDFNYAEALQKSLYFYECQQAGPLPDWNRVEWRADSTMMDEVGGGWYDAGDHVKFNLPMAYSASMLAWGLYQYPDGVEKCGEMQNYVNNLEFVLDYFVACDQGKEVVIQVGSGTVDHTWWGPVELIEYGMADAGTAISDARAVTKVSGKASSVLGEMAAALAAGYSALDGRIDESKRETYLKTAKKYYDMAAGDKDDSAYLASDASQNGFYRSSHFYDELFYSANWMYIATGDESYLRQAEKEFVPNLGKQLGEDELAYGWTMCWDDTMQGAMLLHAINTKDDFYIGRVKRHLEYSMNTVERVTDTNTLVYFSNWGCARYASTDAFLFAVASDTILKGTDTAKYEKHYESQINYILGDNPLGQSYVVGYGDKPAHNAHHRTAHGSWKNDLAIPTDNRHTLYGALAGGPNQDGTYKDDRGNFINNEVATDYNAGFTALLCKMIDKYGGKTDPSFPPKEAHDGPEFYVEALDKGATDSGMTISFKVTNHSAWPARVQDNISFRYYMDLSEVKAAGKNPTDVVIRCDRDQSAMYSGSGVKPAVISEIKQYSGDIYYVEVTLPDGRAVLPVSEGMQQCEILLALVMPDYGSGWDAKNDFSNKDILGAKGETDEAGTAHGIVTKYIPVYIDGKLYYGEEPDGTSADGNASPVETTKPIVTTAPSTSTSETVTTATKAPETTDGDTVYGDANCDGKVTIADATAVLQSIVNPKKYGLSDKGADNADVYMRGDGVTTSDALSIAKFDAGALDSLPESVK